MASQVDVSSNEALYVDDDGNFYTVALDQDHSLVTDLPTVATEQDGGIQCIVIQPEGAVSPANLSVVPGEEENTPSLSVTPQEKKCLWLGCGKRLSGQEDLISHVNAAHIKSKKDVEYKCLWKDCKLDGKSFDARYKMLNHVRTHTGDQPHRCPQCGKTFARRENLKIHLRTHTGEKPYMCTFEGCTKAFGNTSDRFKHTRSHLSYKPYVCPNKSCGKSYTDGSSLRKHMRLKQHGSPPKRKKKSSDKDYVVINTSEEMDGYIKDSVVSLVGEAQSLPKIDNTVSLTLAGYSADSYPTLLDSMDYANYP